MLAAQDRALSCLSQECSLCHGLALWSPVFAFFLQVFVPPKVSLVSATAQFHWDQAKVWMLEVDLHRADYGPRVKGSRPEDFLISLLSLTLLPCTGLALALSVADSVSFSFAAPAGPPSEAMWALGDKIASTIVAQTLQIPTLPWSGSGKESRPLGWRECVLKNPFAEKF